MNVICVEQLRDLHCISNGIPVAVVPIATWPPLTEADHLKMLLIAVCLATKALPNQASDFGLALLGLGQSQAGSSRFDFVVLGRSTLQADGQSSLQGGCRRCHLDVCLSTQLSAARLAAARSSSCS